MYESRPNRENKSDTVERLEMLESIPIVRSFVKQAKKDGEDSELVNSSVDSELRRHGLRIAASTSGIVDATRKHFNLALGLASSGLCMKSTPITTIQDVMETSTVRTCELLFSILEDNMNVFKQPPLGEASQTSILRLCNDLLRRLSRTAETSFCGRILFFLSRFLPLSEKSGLNLMGHFNSQNVTKYEENVGAGKMLTQGCPYMGHSGVSNFPVTENFTAPTTTEDAETGEIHEIKDSATLIPVDPNIYTSFWSLQNFLSNPVTLYEKEKFIVFKKCISSIFTLFSNHKLDKSNDNDSDSKLKAAMDDMISSEAFFAKYLTSPKLLPLQLNDSQFRRHFLVQCLIIFQYLTADVKFKKTARFNHSLSEEQNRVISDFGEKCYKLFVRAILRRETEWSNWKNHACPDITESADKGVMQMYRKRPRQTFDPMANDLGNPELTRLWSIEPNLLSACRNPKRRFDEYKSVNDSGFQWRASRILLASSSYFMPKNDKSMVTSMKDFLEGVIYNTAKAMDEFKPEIAAREEREAEARKKLENALKKKLDPGSSAQAGTSSPNPYEDSLNAEKLEIIAEGLAPKAKQLAAALAREKEFDSTQSDKSNCLNVLSRWAESNAFSLRDLRNQLLNSDPELLMDLTAALKSDEEESLLGSVDGSEGESDVEYDDAQERNFREAKKLLDKLQEESKDDEDVAKKLRDDAATRSGTQLRLVADSFELAEDEEISYRGHRLTPLCVAFSPDSKYLVSTGKESSIVKYSIEEKKVVGVIKRTKNAAATSQNAHSGVIFSVAISPDGNFLASAGFDTAVKVWNFKTLAHIKDLEGHRGAVLSLCFQLKTNNLFSASEDRTVKLWDLDQLGLVDTMYGHQDAVRSVACLQKQRVATAGGRDRTCRVWKVEAESQLVFNGLSQCVSLDCVAMVNEEHFASGSADGTLSLWSFWKKKPLFSRRAAHGQKNGENRWIVSLAALPYSDLLASGSNEGELKLWKVDESFRKLSLVYTYAMDGFINGLSFSNDGKWLSLAVGQEHKDGRWWVDKEARNRVVVIPVRNANEAESEEQRKNGDVATFDDDEDSDED
ncbi:unnamed protein product [Caenorhabditis auriculariae]|uniref:Uncharacterized protein n=1 Tax=Caenorhabditis auriculariae TaxID=2777116 RepID=A0A8S1HS20_9PELO|nr:unnamed protein product [Caenorhabditis auriculariae]